MEAKFKIGDRVVVSTQCDHALGYGKADEFHGAIGHIAGVWTYEGDISTDYDVIIDGHASQNARGCPGFEEEWLTLEVM